MSILAAAETFQSRFGLSEDDREFAARNAAQAMGRRVKGEVFGVPFEGLAVGRLARQVVLVDATWTPDGPAKCHPCLPVDHFGTLAVDPTIPGHRLEVGDRAPLPTAEGWAAMMSDRLARAVLVPGPEQNQFMVRDMVQGDHPDDLVEGRIIATIRLDFESQNLFVAESDSPADRFAGAPFGSCLTVWATGTVARFLNAIRWGAPGGRAWAALPLVAGVALRPAVRAAFLEGMREFAFQDGATVLVAHSFAPFVIFRSRPGRIAEHSRHHSVTDVVDALIALAADHGGFEVFSPAPSLAYGISANDCSVSSDDRRIGEDGPPRNGRIVPVLGLNRVALGYIAGTPDGWDAFDWTGRRRPAARRKTWLSAALGVKDAFDGLVDVWGPGRRPEVNGRIRLKGATFHRWTGDDGAPIGVVVELLDGRDRLEAFADAARQAGASPDAPTRSTNWANLKVRGMSPAAAAALWEGFPWTPSEG